MTASSNFWASSTLPESLRGPRGLRAREAAPGLQADHEPRGGGSHAAREPGPAQGALLGGRGAREDDALKEQRAITYLYNHKYSIAARIINCAIFDKRDEFQSWCVDICDLVNCQDLWRRRTESAALDGTDAMVRARGLSQAYNHLENTLNVIVSGDWKSDGTKVQFAEPAVKYYALGIVDLPGSDEVSLRGAARDGVVF